MRRRRSRPQHSPRRLHCPHGNGAGTKVPVLPARQDKPPRAPEGLRKKPEETAPPVPVQPCGGRSAVLPARSLPPAAASIAATADGRNRRPSRRRLPCGKRLPPAQSGSPRPQPLPQRRTVSRASHRQPCEPAMPLSPPVRCRSRPAHDAAAGAVDVAAAGQGCWASARKRASRARRRRARRSRPKRPRPPCTWPPCRRRPRRPPGASPKNRRRRSPTSSSPPTPSAPARPAASRFPSTCGSTKRRRNATIWPPRKACPARAPRRLARASLHLAELRRKRSPATGRLPSPRGPRRTEGGGLATLGGREQRQAKRKRSTTAKRRGSGEEEECAATSSARRTRNLRRTGTNTAAPRKGKVVVELPCTVRSFAEATGISAGKILGKLMATGDHEQHRRQPGCRDGRTPGRGVGNRGRYPPRGLAGTKGAGDGRPDRSARVAPASPADRHLPRPRRPRQDVAVGPDHRPGRGRARKRRHHAAHPRLQGR